jgi:hypothetical protein
MADYEKIIKLLDGADLFLRNRANSEPAPLNEYDIESMLDIAKVCDEAARIIENLTSSVLVMDNDCKLTKEEIIKALQSAHIQIIPRNEATIKKEILEDFVLEAKCKAWYDSDYEDYLLTKDDLEDVKNKMMREE